MSSTAAELNALGTITSLDIFKRHTDKNSEKPQEFYVSVAKWFTLLWGIIAIVIACFINLFDNLIQLVNIIGSIFYGNVLGIFLLAFFVKFVKGHAVFIAAIVTQLLIFLIYYSFIYIFPSGEEKISYLLLNLIGCVLVMTISCFFQLFDNMLKLSEEK
jgi:Na+/proline symporter